VTLAVSSGSASTKDRLLRQRAQGCGAGAFGAWTQRFFSRRPTDFAHEIQKAGKEGLIVPHGEVSVPPTVIWRSEPQWQAVQNGSGRGASRPLPENRGSVARQSSCTYVKHALAGLPHDYDRGANFRQSVMSRKRSCSRGSLVRGCDNPHARADRQRAWKAPQEER
jgi:hypothetical protein